MESNRAEDDKDDPLWSSPGKCFVDPPLIEGTPLGCCDDDPELDAARSGDIEKRLKSAVVVATVFMNFMVGSA